MSDWPGTPVQQQWPGTPKRETQPDNRGPVEKLFGIGGERYQTWPEKLVRGVVGGVTDATMIGAELTKNAATGQYGPTGEGLNQEDPGKIFKAASLGVSAAPEAGAVAAAPIRSFGESLSRTYPEKVQNQAVNKVQQRFEESAKGGGPSFQQAMETVNSANAAGKPMTLADAGGKPIERLAGNVYRGGGEGTQIADQFLQTRDDESAKRLAADISKYVHGGESMHKTTEALFSARSAAARPAYRVAMDPSRIVDSPRLREFLNDATVRQGIPAGIESQRLEALAAGEKFSPDSAQYITSNESGLPIGVKGVPNMRTLDAVKRGLDAGVESERDAVTGRLSQRGVMLDRVRGAFVEELDSLNPDYASARAAWGGPSSALGAVREGRSIFRSSPDEIAAEFSKLSPGNQEFYRLGVADMLREKLAKTGLSGDEAKSIIRNPWVRDQLRPIFRTPAEFDAFTDAVTAESRMFQRNVSIRKGSQTAERLAEDESQDHTLAIGGAEIAKSLAGGEWLGALRKYIRMKRDLGLRQNPELNERIAKILFSTKPDLTSVETGSRGNYLENPAAILQNATPALVPGASSALSPTPSVPLAQGQ